MNADEIFIADLPVRPPIEVALKAHNEGLDIPRVCFICLAVLECSKQKINAADRKTYGEIDITGVKATDICQGFHIQQEEEE